MRLYNLEVYKTFPNKEIIRDIEFKKNGLNLIVDNTTDIKEDSGNSVGKSTVIHIIDICLNSSSLTKLYKSRDAQGENVHLKKLLVENKVQATLKLINNGKIYSFTRSLYSKGPRYFNNEKVNAKEYENYLKETIFNSKQDKPTFRQLISKFVRNDDIQLNNVIYYLVSTSYAVYEAIYFFLLKINGENVVSERQKLEEKLSKLQNKFSIYQNDSNIPSLDQIEQGLLFIESEINELLEKRRNVDYIEIYKYELEKNSDINNKLDLLNTEIDLLEFEKNSIHRSLVMIEESKSNIDIKIIGEIYEDAKVFSYKLNKKFNDVLNFHNQMVENRSRFVGKQLIKVDTELKLLKQKQEELIDLKKNQSIDLLDDGLLADLNDINNEIEKLNIKKGEFLKVKEIQEGIKKELEQVNQDLESVNSQTKDNDHLVPINEFNSVFKTYSEKLYNEKYLLYYDSEWREKKGGKPFSIGNLLGSMGTGKQRALIIAFDLAYLTYANKKEIAAPKFLIYDQLENTHINQLKTIIQLSKEIEGQLILPILRERINEIDAVVIEQSKIIELSKTDKFFKI
ncbi:DUF2326 domain-containing protein [Peribacillus simplex]|uniref:DUF2326 domain-containing protein n=1 Tax=Peribacillus simplex NBRC 15720 = DSM 1321 TaxID=1349754 RepID=A0A223ENE0_9BACI|nr:DUF2326 domain-containing protein [Peribacillus simplex]ASS96635.1 DUF2326 domain-containing protein [Peribacillus simplex NBRC 15720 = DSM 1321]MEC1395965.1 DUF2326 domain-containing protein [Peribacillus simplex]